MAAVVIVALPVGVLARNYLGQPPAEPTVPSGNEQQRQEQQAGSDPPAPPTYPEGKVFGFVLPEDQLDSMPQVAQDLLGGRMPDRFTYYKAWEGNSHFDPTVPDKIRSMGMQPLLTWEPMDPHVDPREEQPKYALSTIINGEHDEYIRSWATEIRDWGHPLWIRFAHEMNLDIYPWCGDCANGNTPQQYVQAYRHVVDIFREVGATNVKWNWSVNIVSDTTVPIDQLYPGHDYVDEVGIDGYNGGTEQDWGGWTSPQDLFRNTLQELEHIAPDKPIHITETGSSAQGGSRAEWIRNLFHMVKSNPNIKGFTYFNLSKEGGGEANWKLEAAPESAQAFREELKRLNA